MSTKYSRYEKKLVEATLGDINRLNVLSHHMEDEILNLRKHLHKIKDIDVSPFRHRHIRKAAIKLQKKKKLLKAVTELYYETYLIESEN